MKWTGMEWNEMGRNETNEKDEMNEMTEVSEINEMKWKEWNECNAWHEKFCFFEDVNIPFANPRLT